MMMPHPTPRCCAASFVPRLPAATAAAWDMALSSALLLAVAVAGANAAAAAPSPAVAIWPSPVSSAFGPGHLSITHWCGHQGQATQGHGQQAGQTSLLLPWELTTATPSDNQTVPVPGSVLSRALRRAESSVCAHAGAAATIVEDGPGPTRTRWTLNLGSWDENLVDAVDESYSLNVTGSRVEVAAATVWGARHALDSLAQLARTQPDGGVSLSHASVTDEPEYEYRGLMVSPGQRFMTPELLKTTLDAMEIARMKCCTSTCPSSADTPSSRKPSRSSLPTSVRA
jgi:hypothetical protein